jgi:chromosomal replication initiation ATPase DnaA
MNDLDLIRSLQRVAAEEAGLKRGVRELLAHDHEQRKAKFRDSIIYLARLKTDIKLEEIGKMFGARHHTTILGAIRREEARLKRKPPRKDGRTWEEWHEHLYNKAIKEGSDNA